MPLIEVPWLQMENWEVNWTVKGKGPFFISSWRTSTITYIVKNKIKYAYVFLENGTSFDQITMILLGPYTNWVTPSPGELRDRWVMYVLQEIAMWGIVHKSTSVCPRSCRRQAESSLYPHRRTKRRAGRQPIMRVAPILTFTGAIAWYYLRQRRA